MARSIVRTTLFSMTLACAAWGAAGPSSTAHAQQPVDLENRQARAVETQFRRQALDARGALVPADDGMREPARLAFQGGRATVTVQGRDVDLPLPSFPAMSTGGVTVSLTNPRFTNVGDRTTQIDLASGGARTAVMAEGQIDLRFLVSGVGADQPLRFTTTRFTATDMGPLFVGEAFFSVGGPSGAGAPEGAVDIVLPGAGRVCAMAGSPFLDPMIGVPDCDSGGSFGALTRIDPQPLDPRTGELRAVGVQIIRIEPFSAFGFDFPLAPIALLDLDSSALRLTER